MDPEQKTFTSNAPGAVVNSDHPRATCEPETLVDQDFTRIPQRPRKMTVLALKRQPNVKVLVMDGVSYDYDLEPAAQEFNLDIATFVGMVVAPADHRCYEEKFRFRSIDFVETGERVLFEDGRATVVPAPIHLNQAQAIA